MFFEGDEQLPRPGAESQGARIERLHGVHTQHAAADAGGTEDGGGLQRHAQNCAGSDDGTVGAVDDRDGFSNAEAIGVGVHARLAGAAQAEIHRPVQAQARSHGGRGLHGIAGTNNGHVGQRAHDGDVFQSVMRRSVVAVAVAAADADDGHGQRVITQIVANLFQAAQRGEGRDGVDERPHSTESQARRRADHRRFRHSGIHESAAEFKRELVEDLEAKIGGQEDHAVIGSGQFRQRRDESISHRFSSARARSRSSALGGR